MTRSFVDRRNIGSHAWYVNRIVSVERARGAHRAGKRRHGVSPIQSFPHLTAIDNIEQPQILVHGKDKADATVKAQELLKEVGLEDKDQHYPHQLSGGQQQRVAIAKALADFRAAGARCVVRPPDAPHRPEELQGCACLLTDRRTARKQN
ncbi:MAG: ATP-binding cassette domain-containing protein [Kiloniellaceae bacterium]